MWTEAAFAFVESRGKILNVLACLLVEQVGEFKKKKKKAKSHVVLVSWIPSEPETPLANSRAQDAFQVGKDELVRASRTSPTSCGLMLPKLLCKYTYSLSKIGRIGGQNCPSWDILCVQHLLMKEIVLVISQIPGVGIWVASGVNDQVCKACLLYEEYWGQNCWPKVSNQRQVFTQGFSYFLPWARLEYQEVSQGYFCKFALFPLAAVKGQLKPMLRRYAYAPNTLFSLLWKVLGCIPKQTLFWNILVMLSVLIA